MVMTTEVSEPTAMAARHTPNSTVASTASTIGRAPVFPDSSGPLASTTPTRAASRPAYCTAVGSSPVSSPSTIGPSPPRAVIGDTTPTAPLAIAA